VPIGLEIKFCIFGTILSLLAKAIDFWRFAGGLGFFKFLNPYLKFCDHFGVSWQNMASGEGHWFITPLFK